MNMGFEFVISRRHWKQIVGVLFSIIFKGRAVLVIHTPNAQVHGLENQPDATDEHGNPVEQTHRTLH